VLRVSLLFLWILSDTSADDVDHPLNDSDQCIVVVTDSWSAPRGVLRTFKRESDSKWRRRDAPTPILVGRAGVAWGRGAMSAALPGPVKREGDNKAPAGIFRLGTAFGYARHSVATKLPYLALSESIVAVDDPRSRYYNRLVDKSKIRDADWRSAENMILRDGRYKWGVVVMHNVPPVDEAGSCIFLHVWKNSSTMTTGCTAVPEATMLNLLGWLDPGRHPLLIQLPRPIYNELQPRWGLPEL
jgi:L,D-peptidoglycan transpeptidase YkuD (ErfK/YbiS/YcfS/YnhG family)